MSRSAHPDAQGIDGGYPPLHASPLTLLQVADMAQACNAAQAGDGAAPLSAPFTYAGPSAPGLQTGDVITHMVMVGGQCITDAQAERQGAATPSSTRRQVMIVVGVGAAVATAALIYVLTTR